MRQIKPKRAEFEKIITDKQQSFFWHHEIVKRQFEAPYHYHPEFELIHIRQGHGSRVVGDSIKHFGPGDLVFIAPNVPHIWQVSPESPKAETLYIQFPPDLFGAELLKLHELQPVREWMSAVSVGMTFSASVREEMTARLKKFPALNSTERLLEFVTILYRLSQDTGARPLGHGMRQASLSRRDEKRMEQAFQYLNQNLTGTISQAEIARNVRLSPAAFSRLFKKSTRKCFSEVVNELRITQVCQFLTETDRTVSEIAYSCGFDTLSHFNCQFRSIMKTTPRKYRQQLSTIAARKRQP